VSDGVVHAAGAIEERADKLGVEIDIQAEKVLEDENLSIASGSCANADGRNAKSPGDLPREIGWDALEHHGESAQVFENGGLAKDLLGGVVASTLDTKASVGVNGLGLQA
jgi:hypothetical protein